MKIQKQIATIITLFLLFTNASAKQLKVYDSIPGRAASDHYLCRVKFESEDDTAWRDAFVLQTKCKTSNGYFDILHHWTASWIAFESDFNGENIVVEISKKDGSDITEAMVRPVGDATPALIENGKAYINFNQPANVNVDINGQMEKNYTGRDYDGPPVHTISLFANPVYRVPDTLQANVVTLQPGEDINLLNRADWDTLIFAPGVHDIGMPYTIKDNEVLYIPGDAILKGTIHPLEAWQDAASQNFKVYGSGTISGEDILRDPDDKSKKYKPFTNQAEAAHLEGFVVADPAFHTFNMGHSREGAENPNIYKNLKILAWRVNSDGVNAFRNSIVSECFFRTQDDAFYLGAEHVHQFDNVVWNDANGAVLFLQSARDGSSCTFKDVKVIYHRASWHWWSGGRIISMRDTEPGTTISNVHIQNVLVEDPLPAFPPFYATMIGEGSGNITLNNILIENVRQEYDGAITELDGNRGKPQNTLLGLDDKRQWENITFRNCYFNGKWLSSFADGNFKTAYVDKNTVRFEVTEAAPVGGFKVDTSNISEGQCIHFTDTSKNTPTSWNWTFEGGNPATSTKRNPTVTYLSAGTYDVRLIAINGFGTDTINFPDYISVTAPIPVGAVNINNCPLDSLSSGDSHQFQAVVFPANASTQTVKWYSLNPSIASIDASGTLYALNQGSATIVVKTTDGEYTDSCTLNITPAKVDEIINYTVPGEVFPGDTITVVVEYEVSETRELWVFIQQNSPPWNMYGDNRITVDAGKRTDNIDFVVSEGIPTIKNAYKIVANILPLGGGWPDRLDEVIIPNIDAIKRPVAVSGVDIENCPKNELKDSDNYQLIANVIPADATDKTLSWSSSDEAVLTVNQEGLVTTKSPGSATVIITSNDGGFTNSCSINVVATAVNGLAIDNCPETELTENNSYQLMASIIPADATDKTYSWNSSNETVLTVDSNGLITAVSPGDASITVTSNDGGFTSVCNVQVVAEPVDSLLSITAPNEVSPGDTVLINVEYVASEIRKLSVSLELKSDPWTNYGFNSKNIEAGIANESIDFIVSSDIPIAANAYRIVLNMLPNEGEQSEILHQIIKNNVSAIIDSSTVNSKDYLVNLTGSEFKVYPNPVSDIMHFELIDNSIVQIMNLDGQIIYRKFVNSSCHEINIASLNYKGLALVQFISEKAVVTLKVIIE